MKRKSKTATSYATGSTTGSRELRIIGGNHRGRKLRYHGDPVVRPMKHRVREAIFNLISNECAGRYAIDLFAGTGALGLEAISRGAIGANFIERHVPTARLLEENIASLHEQSRCTLQVTSAFLWSRRDLKSGKPPDRFRAGAACLIASAPDSSACQPADDPPWLVFCSPPYSFYVERGEDMLDLLRRVLGEAPRSSTVVVEADQRFDFSLLPAEGWKVREYPPAVVGVWREGG